MRNALRALAAVVLAGALMAIAGAAIAADSSLPGGSAISVAISSPADGSHVPAGAPVAVQGTASIGQGQAVANTLLVAAVDVSGSTMGTGGACGNQNPTRDTAFNTILDCEIAAVRALGTDAASLGTVGELGLVVFAGNGPGGVDAAAADLSGDAGDQALIDPAVSAADFDFVAQNIYAQTGPGGGGVFQYQVKGVGAQTNYYEAVQQALTLAGAGSLPSKVVVMVSDGVANVGSGPAIDSLLAAGGTPVFETFAVGTSANCGSPSVTSFGSLQRIANLTGGTCTHLTNPADIVSTLPGVIAANLTAVEVSVDGGAPVLATGTPAIPLAGPASTTWSATVAGMTPGPHQVCAKASGTDGGGPGSVEECETLIADAAPTVSVADAAGAEGSAIPVAATIADDGPNTVAWSYAAGAGVDAGATCSFGDASAATTTITCTDDGPFTITATVDDGVNAPVFASGTVTVANADPTVAISSPAAGSSYAVGASVPFSASTSDPGSNDTVDCSVDWGDGATTAGCSGSHAYAAGGAYTITVTATDDDGGSSTASVEVSANRPPSCSGVTASPDELWSPNKKFVTVTLSGGSDPDGDAFTIAVTGVTQDEPVSSGGDAEAGSSPDSVQLRADRLGTGDGRVYTIGYTLTDTWGATCSGTVRVGVPHDRSGAAAVDSGGSYDSMP